MGCIPPRGCLLPGHDGAGDRHRASPRLLPHRRFGGVRALAAPVLPIPLSPLQTRKLRPELGAAGEPGAILPSPWLCVGSRSELNRYREAPL